MQQLQLARVQAGRHATPPLKGLLAGFAVCVSHHPVSWLVCMGFWLAAMYVFFAHLLQHRMLSSV
jgi:hypothetical protein